MFKIIHCIDNMNKEDLSLIIEWLPKMIFKHSKLWTRNCLVNVWWKQFQLKLSKETEDKNVSLQSYGESIEDWDRLGTLRTSKGNDGLNGLWLCCHIVCFNNDSKCVPQVNDIHGSPCPKHYRLQCALEQHPINFSLCEVTENIFCW